MKTREQVLADYRANVKRWQERNSNYSDIKPYTNQDLLYYKARLHPTNKQESKALTRALINFICDNWIVTAVEIQKGIPASEMPVLKRLKLLKEFHLVRRESRRYYMPTPRLIEIRKKYLNNIC